MSFSKVQLPNTVITDFYQHSLVLIVNEIAQMEPKKRELDADENHTNISVFQQPAEQAFNTNEAAAAFTTPELFQPHISTSVQIPPVTNLPGVQAAGNITEPAFFETIAPSDNLKINTTGKKWFLGDNRKSVTFVVNDPVAVYLKDESLELLTKLIAALHLNLGDVAIVNLAHETVDHHKIKAELNASIVVMFGVKAEMIDLPFKIPDYKEQQFNMCRYIQFPSFDNLLGDSVAVRTEKSKVWVELKKLFAV